MAGFLRKTRYTLRGGFLLRPVFIAVMLGIIGAVLSQIEEWMPSMNAWVPTMLFPSKSDPAVAQLILSTIASAMMTVVSIVFAVLLMTLTLASSQFSPRIIITFTEDKVTQTTLGIFIGTFGYCIAALPAARSVPHPFAPVLTVTGAMVLAFICSCALVYFINHISEAISANHIVAKLARQTELMIEKTLPYKRGQNMMSNPPISSTPFIYQAPVLSIVSGYIRYIDSVRLFDLAKFHQLHVQVMRRVGHYVPVGVPLFILSSNNRIPENIHHEFRAAFEFGPTRTIQQDIEFGILQIVDIALKAISPAVNDPSTAINCIDQLSAILIHYASRNPPEEVLSDADGKVVVSIPYLDFERLVDSAFEQIRMYSRTDVAVSLRMFRALGDIAHTVPDKASRMVLVQKGRRILASCEKNLEENEIIEMKTRMDALEVFAQKGIDT